VAAGSCNSNKCLRQEAGGCCIHGSNSQFSFSESRSCGIACSSISVSVSTNRFHNRGVKQGNAIANAVSFSVMTLCLNLAVICIVKQWRMQQ
jgi:hypothetical protein